jgi:hypothetical protein
MPSLRSQLTDLAQSFADNVLAALRGASLEELLGGRTSKGPARTQAANDGEDRTAPARRAKPGRLPRRSAEDIAKAVDLVTKLVKSQPLRAEQIRKKLGLDVREMPRILKEGLAKKRLKAKGQKRATTYFAA